MRYWYLSFLILACCSVEPEPISFGQDACDFCRMTIVDQAHAAELVTTKGKVYKFDAIECMVNFEARNNHEYAHKLAMNYSEPGKFLDAGSARFLISENIPSPMGAYLSAFSDMSTAQQHSSLDTDLVLDYGQLAERLKNRKLMNDRSKQAE